MSAEVERGQVDSGLTAACSGVGVQENPKNREGAPPPGDPEGQNAPGATLGGGDAHRLGEGSPADKRSKENDKENERSGAESAAETVKTKVVEAPPPKVNPWTKRTTGRVSVPGSTSPGSQEKGEARWGTAQGWGLGGSEPCDSCPSRTLYGGTRWGFNVKVHKLSVRREGGGSNGRSLLRSTCR